MENWWTAGGMYSTAEDLARFADALYGGQLIRPDTLAILLTPGLDQYGLGLWVCDRESRGRSCRLAQRPGSVMGANTMLLRVLDTETTIVVLSNTNFTDIDAFSFALADRFGG
jgi:D-alanyl-D-alanine carboxypeptidase